MATDSALVVEGLHVSYGGAEACSDVSLRVGRGEIVALIGANGAGKTTTLRAISGLHPPSAGHVRHRSMDLTRKRPDFVARSGIGHVPEGRRLFGNMTVRENLEVGLYQRWPVNPEALNLAFDLFPEIRNLQNSLAYSLSGGEQQMVSIARALLPDPDVLLLDEPSLGLAPIIVDRIIETVRRLRNLGKAILLVEQDTSVALECCDRGYVMATGRIVLSGSRAELLENRDVADAYVGFDGTLR